MLWFSGPDAWAVLMFSGGPGQAEVVGPGENLVADFPIVSKEPFE